MTIQPGWQQSTLEDLARRLKPDPAVRALAVFGSAAEPAPDHWSDIDALLVVAEEARDRFYPALDWLRPFGELYTSDQSAHPFAAVTRACFALGMLLRDRAEGTDHHRHGGSGNEVAALLEATHHPHTTAGLLDMLEQTAVAFDQLAARWSAAYREQRRPLLDWIGLARRS